MKDRVFIAWSGTKEVADGVKKILENEYNYICTIGGNADNNSAFSSVGDTVIQQMKSCNQAIIIFQNKNDGCISNNLFFELGYVFSMYGPKKVHCVKMEGEDIVLPSDFDNAFVEPIQGDGSVDAFSTGIVEYFIGRQKMSINENKMFLIDNRYMIREKITSHYSEFGSKCSDYELAQYVLYYMQAAQMFNDVPTVLKEIIEFKNKHNFEFSSELSLAVNICISFFEMLLAIEEDDDSDVFIDEKTFWKFKKAYTHYIESVKDDEFGIFDEWAKVFLVEHMAFGHMLFANNGSLSPELRRKAYMESKRYGLEALECIRVLETVTPHKENHDDKGIISLFRAYIYRNLFISKSYLGEEDAIDFLKDTIRERENLKNTYSRGSIDTQLYNTFCMEYYLSLISYLDSEEAKDLDEFEIMMYKTEIKEYLQSVHNDSSETAYLHRIQKWCEK